jgi:hypothetical protein
MVRSILSVLAGYVTLAVLVMAGFAIAFVKPEVAFHGDSLTVAPAWLAYTLVLSLIAAAVGGWVCRRVARSHRPVIGLAVLVLAVGVGSALVNRARPEPESSAADVATRLQQARQPDWYAFTLPVLGAAGVLLGGRVRS